MLTKEQLDEIAIRQREMQQRFRSVPDSGLYIEYLEKRFIVYKDVFWPFDDSKPLVENYTINHGEYVLDVCTGSGVIAVFSAYKGAEKVVALDINPYAVKTAKENAGIHGFEDTIDVKLSDMFDVLQADEQFDVITGNLPFRDMPASDHVEASQWDNNLNTHKSFFEGVNRHLKKNGRIYLSQANFGAVEKMKQFAEVAGFSVRLMSQRTMHDGDPRIFYAFELTRK